MGAGPGVVEYLLSLSMPQGSILAVDFDGYFIQKVREFFPEIECALFDFTKDDLASLGQRDCAIFCGSAYVMDGAEFIRLYDALKYIGCRTIIDFHGGYMSMKNYILYTILPFAQWPKIRRLLGREPYAGYVGACHRYARSRSALRRLYRRSGWSVKQETHVEALTTLLYSSVSHSSRL